MGTSNFYNKNASRIFAVELEEDNDWAYEELKENLTEYLNELQHQNFIKKVKGTSFSYNEDGGVINSDLRSFEGTLLGALKLSFQYQDFELEVELSAIVRSGYYEGCNLDWEGRFLIDGEDLDLDYNFKEKGYLEEVLEYTYDYSPSKAIAYAKLIEKKVSLLQESLVTQLEDVYRVYSEPLIVAAGFSNGETIYQREDQTKEEAITAYIENVI